MKRWLCLFSLVFCFCMDDVLYAQVIQVKRFTEVQEILWAPEQRRDENGGICALVRVMLPPAADVLFQGNVIGDVVYRGNEYRVYLSEGSRYLRLHYPGCETLWVDFQTFGYDGVGSKRVYELVLELPEGLRRNMSRADYEQLITQTTLLQKQENFAEAIASYEACKRKLADQGEHGYVQEVQEQINYCKRRITLKQLNADSYRTVLNDGLCCYKAQGKFGFVDSVGNVVVPPIYEEVLGDNDFHDGIAWVKKDSLWGSINRRGEVVVPYTYKFADRLAPFSYKENRCVIVSNRHQKAKVIDYMTGQDLLPAKYHYYYDYQNSFNNISCDYFCLRDSKMRDIFIDKKTGKEVGRLPSGVWVYSYLGHGFSEVYRHWKIKDSYDSRYGIVNKHGEFLLPCEYIFESLEKTNQFLIARHYADDNSPLYYEARIFNVKQQVFVSDIYRFGDHVGNLVEYYNNDEQGVMNYVTRMKVVQVPREGYRLKFPQTPGDPINVLHESNGHTFLYDVVTGEKHEYPRPLGDFRYGFALDENAEGKTGFVNAKGEVPFGWFDHVKFFQRYGDVIAAEVYNGSDHYYITPSGDRLEADQIAVCGCHSSGDL